MNQLHFVTSWTKVLSRQNLKPFVHILLPCVFEKLILNFLSIPCFKKKSLQGHLKYENINYSVTLPWLPWRSTVIPTQSRYMITQFSSVAQSCLTLCDPMDCSTPGFPVHHQLPEFTQTLVHWVGDAIQPSHPLSSPSPPAFNRSQHQGLFKWVSSSHEVAKILEFQLQHQSFQWIFGTDFL